MQVPRWDAESYRCGRKRGTNIFGFYYARGYRVLIFFLKQIYEDLSDNKFLRHVLLGFIWSHHYGISLENIFQLCSLYSNPDINETFPVLNYIHFKLGGNNLATVLSIEKSIFVFVCWKLKMGISSSPTL